MAVQTSSAKKMMPTPTAKRTPAAPPIMKQTAPPVPIQSMMAQQRQAIAPTPSLLMQQAPVSPGINPGAQAAAMAAQGGSVQGQPPALSPAMKTAQDVAQAQYAQAQAAMQKQMNPLPSILPAPVLTPGTPTGVNQPPPSAAPAGYKWVLVRA